MIAVSEFRPAVAVKLGMKSKSPSAANPIAVLLFVHS